MSRRLHATAATIAVLPLIVTVATGAAYRTLRVWFEFPKESVHWLLDVHQMSVFGLHTFYPLLMAAAGLALIWTGASVLRVTAYATRFAKRVKVIFLGPTPGAVDDALALPALWPAGAWTARATHRLFVAVLWVPSAVTFVSGAAYTVVKHWLPASVNGDDKHWTKRLMGVHQGSWTLVLSPAWFVPALGTGLLVILYTGARMSSWWKPPAALAAANPATHSYAPITSHNDDLTGADAAGVSGSDDNAHAIDTPDDEPTH